jgi:hypothetical protein
MVKSITVGITDELSAEMDHYNEVNWSAVARDCIQFYINRRKSSSIEAALLKVKTKQEEEFQKGFEYFLKNIDKYSLHDIEVMEKTQMEENTVREQGRFFASLIFHEESDQNFVDDLSSSFLRGFHASVKEIAEKSRAKHE